MLWERASYTTPLEKRVRSMAAFIVDAYVPNHRLLHASLRPPEKPSYGTLLDMSILAVDGLTAVINQMDDPIIDHFRSQLEILAIEPDEAMYRVDNALWWRGYGDRCGTI